MYAFILAVFAVAVVSQVLFAKLRGCRAQPVQRGNRSERIVDTGGKRALRNLDNFVDPELDILLGRS